jgi:hypothetical protein
MILIFFLFIPKKSDTSPATNILQSNAINGSVPMAASRASNSPELLTCTPGKVSEMLAQFRRKTLIHELVVECSKKLIEEELFKTTTKFTLDIEPSKLADFEAFVACRDQSSNTRTRQKLNEYLKEFGIEIHDFTPTSMTLKKL